MTSALRRLLSIAPDRETETLPAASPRASWWPRCWRWQARTTRHRRPLRRSRARDGAERERQEKRGPGRVEEGEDAGSRSGTGVPYQIPHRLARIVAGALEAACELVEHRVAQPLIEPAADPHQDADRMTSSSDTAPRGRPRSGRASPEATRCDCEAPVRRRASCRGTEPPSGG